MMLTKRDRRVERKSAARSCCKFFLDVLTCRNIAEDTQTVVLVCILALRQLELICGVKRAVMCEEDASMDGPDTLNFFSMCRSLKYNKFCCLNVQLGSMVLYEVVLMSPVLAEPQDRDCPSSPVS